MAVSTKRRAASSSRDDYSPGASPPPSAHRPIKKAHRSLGDSESSVFKIAAILDAPSSSRHARAPARLPARMHSASYHRPQLLDHPDAIIALLTWFETVSSKRDMPWRADFIDASHYSDAAKLREARKKRAYQVWISEIMLQQTRVETVKTYWLNWMNKWPTIEALAAADPEAVLAAWRGLGYYSRATRIHTAAKRVVADPHMMGLLPETPQELEKNVPGVGPYTAGAISSIVFGQAVPIIDGNVARVLSRQLALYANPKTKLTSHLMWATATKLVHKASALRGGKATVPGQWNQALMELGSTVCTPTKPRCDECPIQATCSAHQEAQADTIKANNKPNQAAGAEVLDIEDICTLCERFPSVQVDSISTTETHQDTNVAKQKSINNLRQATLSFGLRSASKRKRASSREPSALTTIDIERHICKFPMKLEKKTIRQEECLVCIIQRSSGEFLLEQRPASGLLASTWQFPSLTLSTTAAGSPSDQRQPVFGSKPTAKLVDPFTASLIDAKNTVESQTNLGSITHIFSHLHLTMHVYSIALRPDSAVREISNQQETSTTMTTTTTTADKNKNFGSRLGDMATRRWANVDQVEAETMGTGMRNCWLALQSQNKLLSTKTRTSK